MKYWWSIRCAVCNRFIGICIMQKEIGDVCKPSEFLTGNYNLNCKNHYVDGDKYGCINHPNVYPKHIINNTL
jgi:hypothetical protein